MRKSLKPVRVAVSLLVFALYVCLFLNVAVLSGTAIGKILMHLQFAPSLIDFLHAFSWAAAGFTLIALLTLLFGRLYCSSLCPLGAIQDIANGIRLRMRSGKPGKQYRKPLRWVAYPLLGLTIVSLMAGNLFLITLLDPFSIAGRSLAGLLGPLIDLPDNPLIFTLHALRSPDAESVTRSISSWPPWLLMVFQFLIILSLAAWKGRWYCTVICPVGTVLGILSRVSLFRLRLDPISCQSCGNCLEVCKSGCIDMDEKKLDFDRCVTCFNCLDVCSERSISYEIRRVRDPRIQGAAPALTKGKSVNGRSPNIWFPGLKEDGQRSVGNGNRNTQGRNSRRDFLKMVTLAMPAVAFYAWVRSSGITDDTAEWVADDPFPDASGEENPYPAIPPGAVSVGSYKDRCTSCHVCVSHCPSGVLQPSVMSFGLAGIFQPRMDFETGYCRFECTKCMEICPSGAILYVTPEKKKRIRIGMARFIKNRCLPVSDRIPCRRCHDLCPVKAIILNPYLGDLTIPSINEATCTGCGACEYICPARPVRAIYVEPLTVHEIAREPVPDLAP